MFKRILAAVAALMLSGALGYAITVTGSNTNNQNMFDKIGYLQLSAENAITAAAGGGQPNAYQLTNAYSRVTVVATANDSVKLPALCNVNNVGMFVWVSNADAADSLNVFPPVGDTINLLSPNAAFPVPAVRSATFVCVSTGLWQSIISS